MSSEYDSLDHSKPRSGIGCLSVLGLIVLSIVVTVIGTLWAINSSWLNGKFKLVELSDNEQVTLSNKLAALGAFESTAEQDTPADTSFQLEATESKEALQPEVYAEDNSKRRIELTERELNSLLAENTDLAEQLVVDLTQNMASVKLLIDMDPDFPFIGGKTLKVSSGAELSYANNRPSVILKGVSVWGVPIPNSWLGGVKNIDIIEKFGDDNGFWQSFAEGIENIQVEDGKLLIQLAE